MGTKTKGHENVCNPAVKYKFSNKLNCWVRTWFTIETDENKVQYFKQNNAYSDNRNTDWNKWVSRIQEAK